MWRRLAAYSVSPHFLPSARPYCLLSLFNYESDSEVKQTNPLQAYSWFSSEDYKSSPQEIQERIQSLRSDPTSLPKNDGELIKLLKTLIRVDEFHAARQLLFQMESVAFVPCVTFVDEYTVLFNHILRALYRNGTLDLAIPFFEKMKATNQINTTSWHITIKALSKVNRCTEVIDQWEQMIASGTKPNEITTACALYAIATTKDSKKAVSVFNQIIKYRIPQETKLMNQILYTLYKCNVDTRILVRWFDKMKSLKKSDIISWGIIIKALSTTQPAEAIAQWDNLTASGLEPNKYTATAVLSAATELEDIKTASRICKETLKYNIQQDLKLSSKLLHTLFKYGDIKAALPLFNKMRASNQLDIVSWYTALKGLSLDRDSCQKSITLWQEMMSGTPKPDAICATIIFSSVATLEDPKIASQVYNDIIELQIPQSMQLKRQIVHTFFKCGSIEIAMPMFEDMKKTNLLERKSWNIALRALAKKKDSKGALALFRYMEIEHLGIDSVTILAVLTAYKAANMAKEAIEMIDTMKAKYGILPNKFHFTCLLTILHQCNKEEERKKYSKMLYTNTIPNK